MFYRTYTFPKEEVISYAHELIRISLLEYITYIREYCTVSFIESQDIVQFSSFIDATRNICSKLESCGDQGLSYLEIGKLLLDDGAPRNDMAYRKYGENHTKTAQELGLTQMLYNVSYLTCIGKIFFDLTENEQISLLRRLVLRNKYIMLLLIISQKENTTLKSQMGILSESTQKRRLSNVTKLWKFILSDGIEVTDVLSNVAIQ